MRSEPADDLIEISMRMNDFSAEWMHCDRISSYVARMVSQNSADPLFHANLFSSALNELLETYANPTFAIMFALSYQTYAFIKIILNARPRPFNRFSRILTKFFILTFTFKLLPLYLVVGTPPLNEFINKIYKQSLNIQNENSNNRQTTK
jgi:hypothetical protein